MSFALTRILADSPGAYPFLMAAMAIPDGSLMARARDWRNAGHVSVCDLIEPWEHGTVIRTSRYPTYYDFNVLRVEQEIELDVPALAVCADQALAGLAHRRIDFDLLEQAESRRSAFEAAGWKTMRLVWMLHRETPERAESEVSVEQVSYDETTALRLAWHLEERAEMKYEGYAAAAREIALRRGARVLAVREAGGLIAFSQLQWNGPSAEIDSVYVHPEHRGRGLGTALTRAAIVAGKAAEELWIVADDEDRPKDLYARLGFQGVWVTEEFLLLP